MGKSKRVWKIIEIIAFIIETLTCIVFGIFIVPFMNFNWGVAILVIVITLISFVFVEIGHAKSEDE